MLNYASTPPLAAMAEIDSRQLIAAELRSLIARIEISMRLIDAAMEPDDSAILSAISGSTEIVVLDDVTPVMPRRAPPSTPAGRSSAALFKSCRNLATRRRSQSARLICRSRLHGSSAPQARCRSTIASVATPPQVWIVGRPIAVLPRLARLMRSAARSSGFGRL